MSFAFVLENFVWLYFCTVFCILGLVIMGIKKWVALVLFVLLVFEGYFIETVNSATVTYDHRALVIDGKRRILQSGSIHYPRSTPEVNSEFM